jgi:hypothetical protein
MKTYITLIKQAKAEIELKQKEIDQVFRDKSMLEQQIGHLSETLEREYIEASFHKTFFNPVYFDRITNKIRAYRHLLNTKNEEFEMLREEILSLFSTRKKYEIVLQNLRQRLLLQHNKREEERLEDLFRSKFE